MKKRSSKTMNLCSKCFADIQKKPAVDDRPSKSASPSAAFAGEPPADAAEGPAVPASPEKPADEEPSPLFGVSAEDRRPGGPAERAAKARHLPLAAAAPSGTTRTPTKRPPESASTLESGATPEKRPRAEAKDGEGGGEEEEEEEEEDDDGGGGGNNGGTPKQKNRRRCFSCQSKLELVQQELGSCRCGYVFCMLHRLPEQHHCLFDHLGRGREEAVLKMVKLERKVGRSCQRIGEECS
ncbi:AN1-type zinc finger protein 3 homolog isoform X2 [Stigmatopora nigra]